ncbi:MAG: helix-turn-helix domain-containing protein [Ruminococcus sp.]|nr:helix-turn-helix domain-containing protein [Ruminococcus sp.]
MTEFDELRQKMIDYRAKHNLSMDSLAKLCNVSNQTIYLIENGLQKPSRVTFAKICNVVLKEN